MVLCGENYCWKPSHKQEKGSFLEVRLECWPYFALFSGIFSKIFEKASTFLALSERLYLFAQDEEHGKWKESSVFKLTLVNISMMIEFKGSLRSNFIGNEKFNEKIEIYLNFQEDIIGFSYLMSKPLEKYQFPEPPSAFLSEAFEAPQ